MQKTTLKPWISQPFGAIQQTRSPQGPCRPSVSRLVGAFDASVDENPDVSLLWALQRGDEATAMELLNSALALWENHQDSSSILVGGLEHFLFSHILGIIIPID